MNNIDQIIIYSVSLLVLIGTVINLAYSYRFLKLQMIFREIFSTIGIGIPMLTGQISSEETKEIVLAVAFICFVFCSFIANLDLTQFLNNNKNEKN